MLRNRERLSARQRIETILALRAIEIVFQPIVDIRRGVIVGVEALSRFSAEPRRTPDVWFEEAWAVGLGLELEILAIDMALRGMPSLPAGVYVAVNADPRTLESSELRELLLGSDRCARIVLEITEHAAVEDYDRTNAALVPFRALGARLAIDDAGAGFASLQHVLRLRPEIIKLDRSLTMNVEDNPVRSALTAALVTFGASLNATICAEGVETQRQLVALQKLGVSTAQGYFLARPGPLPLPPIPQGIWMSRAESRPTPARLGSPAVMSPARLAALEATALMDTLQEEPFQRLARHAQRLLGADIALVSLVDDHRQFFKSAVGLSDPALRETPLTHSFCQHAVTTRLPLVIDDARLHPLVQDNGAVADLGVLAYLGIPLVTSSDHALGSFCVIEHTPRHWVESDIESMREIAAMVVDLIEMRYELAAHREREETQRLLFHQVPTASAHCELDGTIRTANRRFTAALGYADEALDGKPGALVLAPEEEAPLWELHRTLLVGEVPEAVRTTRLVRADGSTVTMSVRWVIVRNGAGAAVYSLVTLLPLA